MMFCVIILWFYVDQLISELQYDKNNFIAIYNLPCLNKEKAGFSHVRRPLVTDTHDRSIFHVSVKLFLYVLYFINVVTPL